MTVLLEKPQILAISALLIAAAALGFVLFGTGPAYTIHAHFANAGRLIKGDRVELAGRKVGTVSTIGLTANGQADVALSINDDGVIPLHEGTRAAIRVVGQAGIANRFVSLTPGPSTAPSLPNGGALPTSQTSGIVDIDALLDSFGPAERANLRQLITYNAQIYAGSGSRYFNSMLGKLDPGLAQLDGFSSELALDRIALGQFVHTASTAATAIASRHRDLSSAVQNTALSLGAIARERSALADTLARMPPVLAQAQGTLARTGAALTALRPALREILPAAPPLDRFLSRANSVLPQAGPVVARLVDQLPSLNESLVGLVPLQLPAVRALGSTGQAMKDLTPILQGFRFYGADFILGVLRGLAGVVAGEYDGYGHYVKNNFVQNYQTLPAGPLATLLSDHPLAPNLFNVRTRLMRRCPGGDTPPAPDGSSPWVLGQQFCSPQHDTPLSVDFP